MIKILSCIVCDDVRQEKSGKYILIGIYGGDLKAYAEPDKPTLIPISVWIEGVGRSLGEVALKVRGLITDSDKSIGESAFETGGNVKIESTEIVQQFVFQLPVRIDFNHSIQIELKEGDEDWMVLRTLKITSLPTESPKPS